MKIGILTAGGDCPGLNAAIRGVGKTAIVKYGMKLVGISDGFTGMTTWLFSSYCVTKLTFEEVLDFKYSTVREMIAVMFSSTRTGFDPILENLSVIFSSLSTSRAISLARESSGCLF